MTGSREIVAISTSTFGTSSDRPLTLLREAGFEIRHNPHGRRLTRQEIQDFLGNDVVGLVAGLEPLDEPVLSGSGLRAISRVGAGLANVDLEAAARMGIQVRSTPDAPSNAVAELTLCALLCLLRQLPIMNEALHKGRWEKVVGREVRGLTVLIVGYGRIGRRVADLLRPFGVHQLITDPEVDPSIAKDGAELVSLHEALPLADVVSVHASGESAILGYEEFALMKPKAVILNAARGASVSEAALLDALANERIAGAWVDVFEDEPYEGPLAEHPEVLLTPHAGSYTAQCRRDMEISAVENVIDMLDSA